MNLLATRGFIFATLLSPRRQESRYGRIVGMRILTVSSLHRQWGPSHRPRHADVPFIRLAGKWLATLDLTPGCKVRVEFANSGLYITPESARASSQSAERKAVAV